MASIEQVKQCAPDGKAKFVRSLSVAAAVARWEHPHHVSKLRLFSYYKHFVRRFAMLAVPLHKLIAYLAGK